jgi:uncharacterized protein YbaR (Trm112 family)
MADFRVSNGRGMVFSSIRPLISVIVLASSLQRPPRRIAMSRKALVVSSMVCLLIAAGAFAGMGMTMKCTGVPAEDGKPKIDPCGYSTEVVFGGGMFFDQAVGYCRKCKRFVSVHWTRPGAANNMPPQMQVTPKPDPLGEVWDSATGHVLTVYACPHCKGPFAEIKKRDDLTHCPACNKGHFQVDPNAPVMAVD